MTGPTCDCCENILLRLCQFLGLTTALGLWGVGVEAIFYHHSLGFYLISLAVIITFLETVFLLHYLVEVCVSPASICVRVWNCVLWLDDWRKGVLYLLLAIPCFLCPQTVLLGMVSGAMLALTGLLYCIKTYQTRKKAAVEQFISKRTYDRFDEDVQEDLEDSIVNPTANISAMSVADQIEVLEV
ncbi:transmembrane protein 72-like [Babylonia areolata]|uniref:transmembrane protein 72-like n=1 Tax=Babylonia areolata TaxID=304850 RepID=UPI003FD29714